MLVVNEKDIEAKELPGRSLKWLVTPENTPAKNLSACVICIRAGETVKPAHCHPEGEELVYITQGEGKALIGEKVYEVREGCAVLFPQNTIHMLGNTGAGELRAVCFYAPATDLSKYKFFEDVDFELYDREGDK